MPTPISRVAWYVTGRFYEDRDHRLQDVGYFLYLAGVDGALFAGPIGESAALLTFRSEPFEAQTVTNGDLSIGLDMVGDFGVYLSPGGGASFDDPGSFSRGRRIARFRRASVVMGETLSSPLLGGLAISMNVFSAELIGSEPFELDGACYDFRDLLPHGVTQWGTASATPLAVSGPYTRVVAFTGSAIAAG